MRREKWNEYFYCYETPQQQRGKMREENEMSKIGTQKEKAREKEREKEKKREKEMGWNSRQKEKWSHFFHTKQNKSFLIWEGTKKEKKKPNNKTHTNPHNQNTTHTSFGFFFTLLSPTHNKVSIWKLNSHQLQYNPFLSQQGKKNWFCFCFFFVFGFRYRKLLNFCFVFCICFRFKELVMVVWCWVFVGDGVDGGVGLRTWGVNVE